MSLTRQALKLMDSLVAKENPNTDRSLSSVNKIKQAITLLQDAEDDFPNLTRFVESLQNLVEKKTNEPTKDVEDTDEEDEQVGLGEYRGTNPPANKGKGLP
jgi:hypothetical protein